MPAPAVQLAPAFREQDARFQRAFSLIEEAIAARVFPGATLTVAADGSLLAWKGYGRFTYDPESLPVFPTTVFDLASVTKVAATTAAAMVLFERGALLLDTPIVELLPEYAPCDDRRSSVTVRMLLAHSAGLPAYAPLYKQANKERSLLSLAFDVPLEAAPGARAEYSDVGFILLGELLQRISGEPLDQFCAREIFEPLGMTSTRFLPPLGWKPSIPPTEHDVDYRGRCIQGEVNDENCSAIGGVSGHAGLFGSGVDIATFAQCILNGGGPIVSRNTVEVFTRRQSEPAGTSRALGWDIPSAPSQSGRYFGPRSFGHLGFTGTSIWCDPDRQLSITLLTNRTWPDRKNQEIKRVRPLIHDAVIEALEGKAP